MIYGYKRGINSQRVVVGQFENSVITLYDAVREDVWCYAFGELRSLIQ